MASTRTQIYLTAEQRRRLDALSWSQDRPLAELIREAVDAYLAGAPPEPRAALDATFGVDPSFRVPSRDDWDGRG